MNTDCTEEWRTIPDWPLYEVSSFGRIRRRIGDRHRAKPGYVLKQFPVTAPNKRTTYWCVRLSKGTTDSFRQIMVHRAVASAFIGECPSGRQVNHIDGVKTNNFYRNLEYVTQSQNMIHAGSMGLRSQQKITADQAIEIFKSTDKQAVIAERYGIVFQSVSDIKRRKTWAHATKSLQA